MEEVEQQEAAATAGDEQDLDFASCPREDDDQEDLHPPYGLLDDVTGLGPERDDRDTEAGDEANAGAVETRADQDRLASLRFQTEDADQVARPPVQVSSPGSRVANSRSATGAEDVAGQIQQLISVVGVLASRLERVEAASTSDSSSGSQWRPRSDTVNLGYVDHAALDRWYAQAVQNVQDLQETWAVVLRCLLQVLQGVQEWSSGIPGSVDQPDGFGRLEIGRGPGALEVRVEASSRISICHPCQVRQVRCRRCKVQCPCQVRQVRCRRCKVQCPCQVRQVM